MQKVVEFLQKNPVQYLATVGRDGKAKCRPFMFCFEQDGKLWFCTNNTKDVYKDMLANPEVEVSVSSLRADYVSDKTLEMLHKCGQRTATIAVEAGSDRLRKVINKQLTNEEIDALSLRT